MSAKPQILLKYTEAALRALEAGDLETARREMALQKRLLEAAAEKLAPKQRGK